MLSASTLTLDHFPIISVSFLIRSVQLTIPTDRQLLIEIASNFRTRFLSTSWLVLEVAHKSWLYQRAKPATSRHLIDFKSINLRPYQPRHRTVFPSHILSPHVQLKWPYVVIYHTSAVYRLLGCYPIPIPICIRPKKGMFPHATHEARRKPIIFSAIVRLSATSFSPRYACLAEDLSTKHTLLLITVRPDNKLTITKNRTLRRTNVLHNFCITFFITFMNINSPSFKPSFFSFIIIVPVSKYVIAIEDGLRLLVLLYWRWYVSPKESRELKIVKPYTAVCDSSRISCTVPHANITKYDSLLGWLVFILTPTMMCATGMMDWNDAVPDRKSILPWVEHSIQNSIIRL